MADLTIVEWGNPLGGGGYTLYVDHDGPTPDKALQRAAEALVFGPVGQPPEGAQDSDRYPVWSLHHVEVDGLGSHWCFAVQGRGGAFGRAGSCQFAFAGGDRDPAEVWETGVRMVGTDGRLSDTTHRRTSNWPVEEHQLAQAITALAEQRRRIVIDGDPTEVAATIQRLLAALPVSVIRMHSWATYLLQPPARSEHAMVTGRWPEELRQTRAAARMGQWLDSASSDTFSLDQHPRWRDAVSWLIDTTMNDVRYLQSYRALSGMPELLDRIVHEQLGLEFHDIPHYVKTGSERLRQGSGPRLVRKWARQNPAAAIERLVSREPRDWLETLLLDGLLEAHAKAGPGENPMLFPPAGEEPFTDWYYVLAALLKHRFRNDKAATAEFVLQELMGAGKPLSDRSAIERATPWLQLLGLSPNDPSLGIFPVPTEQIIGELKQFNKLSRMSYERLEHAPDPVEEIRLIVDGLDHISPKAAASLLRTADEIRSDRAGVHDLGTYLVAHNRKVNNHPETEVGWFDQMLHADLPRPVTSVLVEIGNDHLDQHGSRLLPAPYLQSVLRFQADEPGISQAIRRALVDSASYLQMAATSQEEPPGTAPSRSEPHDDGTESTDDAEVDQPERRHWSPAVAELLVLAISVALILYVLVNFLLQRR